MRRFRWLTWLSCALLAGIAHAAPEDPPADFLIDISSTSERPLALHLKTRKAIWQLPQEQVRQGYGLGFFSIARNNSNNCEARMFVEVESMQGSNLEKCVEEAIAGKADALAQARCRLVGEVKSGERVLHKVGRTKCFGVKLQYTIQVLDSVPLTEDPVTSLVLAYDGALITVTVQNYSRTTDYFTPLLKSLEIVKLPTRTTPTKLKLVDATRGVYRYLTADLPKGLMPNHADCPGMAAACFTRHDPETSKPMMRLMVAKSDATRDTPFVRDVEMMRSNLLEIYENVTLPSETKLGDLEGYIVTYVDRTEEGRTRHGTKVYVKLFDQMWTWTLQTWATDTAQLKKDRSEFDRILASVNMWHASPQ